MVPRTKGDKARVIELDTQTRAVLTGWKAIQDKERQLVGAGYEDNGLIFCQPDGRPYHPEAFSKTFDRRLRQQKFVDLPRIRLHDLRVRHEAPSTGRGERTRLRSVAADRLKLRAA